jgi:hypothetical protein
MPSDTRSRVLCADDDEDACEMSAGFCNQVDDGFDETINVWLNHVSALDINLFRFQIYAGPDRLEFNSSTHRASELALRKVQQLHY